MSDEEICDGCGTPTENCYRCQECGKDLAEEGTGGDWR